MAKGERIASSVIDSGRTDAILEEVTDTIERRRGVIEGDPSISTITLLIRLDKGPRPRITYRTESYPPR